MVINDKRENTNTLPIKNIIQGNCFIHKEALYIKTNAAEWIEQTNPDDCFCLRVANGHLTKLDNETMVTPVDTECNIITKDEKQTTEETTTKENASKYILITWMRYDDEVCVDQFDTESEAQKFMETNYKRVLAIEKGYEAKTYYKGLYKTRAKIETDQDVFLWQIKEVKF